MDRTISSQNLEKATKVSAIIFGILYVAGLLVTQIQLGDYGIPDFDMAKVRYIFTGALLFLCLLPIIQMMAIAELVFFYTESAVSKKYLILGVLLNPAFQYFVITSLYLSVGNALIIVEHKEYIKDLELTSKDTLLIFLLPWLVDLPIRIAQLIKNKLNLSEKWQRLDGLLEFRWRKSNLLMLSTICFGLLIHLFSYTTWMHKDFKDSLGGGGPRYACIGTKDDTLKLIAIVHESSDFIYYMTPGATNSYLPYEGMAKRLCNVKDIKTVELHYEVALFMVAKNEIKYFAQSMDNPND